MIGPGPPLPGAATVIVCVTAAAAAAAATARRNRGPTGLPQPGPACNLTAALVIIGPVHKEQIVIREIRDPTCSFERLYRRSNYGFQESTGVICDNTIQKLNFHTNT
jgi:hypothetical protein